MDQAVIEILHDCATRSQQGQIAFPEVLKTLMQAGIESYHADFYREETTYYQSSGHSHVEALKIPSGSIAHEFSAKGVEQAVRASQRGEIKYQGFLRQAMEAGCTGYGVYLTGKKVIYWGRTGDHYIEPFPQSSAKP